MEKRGVVKKKGEMKMERESDHYNNEFKKLRKNGKGEKEGKRKDSKKEEEEEEEEQKE